MGAEYSDSICDCNDLFQCRVQFAQVFHVEHLWKTFPRANLRSVPRGT